MSMFFRNKSDDANQKKEAEQDTSSNQQAQSQAARRFESSPESIDSRSVHGGGRHALREDDDEDENIANRIFINRSGTEFPRLLHACNPSAFYKGSDKYAMAAYKVPPPFCKECGFHIENDGLSGSFNFKWPESCRCPRKLLGFPGLSSMNPFYQATLGEINRVTGHSDNKSKFKMGVDFPFKCETKTTSDITNGGGQRADVVPVNPKLGDNPENFAGNISIFVKKANQNFAVTTRGTVQKSTDGLLSEDGDDEDDEDDENEDVEMVYPQLVPTSNHLVRNRAIKRARKEDEEDDTDDI